jgi:hypothetical protein
MARRRRHAREGDGQIKAKRRATHEQELDLDPAEKQLRLELYLRDEIADITRQIAADQQDHNDDQGTRLHRDRSRHLVAIGAGGNTGSSCADGNRRA